MPRLSQSDTLEVINVVLLKSHELHSPLTEIRSVTPDPDPDTCSVLCFGMNDEKLVFRVSREPMDDELRADLVEGTIA